MESLAVFEPAFVFRKGKLHSVPQALWKIMHTTLELTLKLCYFGSIHLPLSSASKANSQPTILLLIHQPLTQHSTYAHNAKECITLHQGACNIITKECIVLHQSTHNITHHFPQFSPLMQSFVFHLSRSSEPLHRSPPLLA